MKEEKQPTIELMRQDLGIKIRDFEELKNAAEYFADCGIIPKDLAQRPGACALAMGTGMELGLGPLTALQNFAVINGRPSLYGDVALALCRNHPLWREDTWSEEFSKDRTAATCTGSRGIGKTTSRTFTMDDARRAGLLEKAVWKQYPLRMLQMRARSWILRDLFPDSLKGVLFREEAMTIDVEEIPQTRHKNSPPTAIKPLLQSNQTKDDQKEEQPEKEEIPKTQEPKEEPALILLKKALAKEDLEESALIEFMHFKGIGEDLGSLKDIISTGHTQWVRDHWTEFKTLAKKIPSNDETVE